MILALINSNKHLLFIFTFFCVKVYSQDPQFSQYYNAPLFLNPALTGATDCYRVGMNARTQWIGLSGSFNTGLVYADLNYEDLNSGFGLMAMYDRIGNAKLSSGEISGFYSYEASFVPQFNLRMGLQGTYVSKTINYNGLLFPDQFDQNTTAIIKDITTDPTAQFNRKSYMDVSSGLLLFGEDTYWLGISGHHLNRPDQSFYRKESRLPIRFSIHGGYSFLLSRKKTKRDEDGVRIIPTFLYKAQAKFDQTDLGVYFINNTFLAGLWYRGIFLKEDENIRNSDALIFQAGVRFKDFSFTYSYDHTVSKLQFRNTLGSHEISIIYLFCAEWPRRKKPPRRTRKLPCPDFKRSIR